MRIENLISVLMLVAPSALVVSVNVSDGDTFTLDDKRVPIEIIGAPEPRNKLVLSQAASVAEQDKAALLSKWMPLAEQGDAGAQFKLGMIYGAFEEYEQAARWFRRGAEQGDAQNQAYLGQLYEAGKGVPQNYAEAARWYAKAAEQGDASAQMRFAILYQNGWGVPQSDTEAAKWCRKAAEQGHAVAQAKLGNMYAYGKGMAHDYVEAAGWYRKAAEQGVYLAQAQLGLLYGKGQGVSQNYVEAHKWLNIAADLIPLTTEREPALLRNEVIKNRDNIAAVLTPAELSEAQKLAREWIAAFRKRGGSVQ